MSTAYLALFAFIAGAAIAIQSGINAQLGEFLKSPLIATTIAFSSSLFFTLIAVITLSKEYPDIAIIKAVPTYLWFSGGVLSAFAISMFYYIIPQVGIGTMMSYALTGQIIMAMIAGHFGWFDLPIEHINASKFSGALALVVGIVLINKG